MTTQQAFYASDLSVRLMDACMAWIRAHPDSSAESAMHGILDATEQLLYALVSSTAKPGESIAAVDAILARLRTQILQREP